VNPNARGKDGYGSRAAGSTLFDGFVERDVSTERGLIHVRIGGTGPPVLLLHGYPQTHVMWRDAAALLADRFTVVAADLPGYGGSFRPVPTADHAAHSKRALATDLAEAMSELGYHRFSVVGHDRGGRVAYRMALDQPDTVAAVAVLDVVPTAEVWGRADADLAILYWHWAFLAQPAPLPERLIAADPDAFFDFHVRALGLGDAPGRYPMELLAGYRSLLDDAGTVQAICEDYRAGATVDRQHDEADRGRRRIDCPLLALWSEAGGLPRLYVDVIDVWRAWAADPTGYGMPTSHFLVEDAPRETAEALATFLSHHQSATRP
jgi:haloacetate dehalogenase